MQRLADGGWEPVSTRIDEGSEHLRIRLGLDVHQFCQVVLLPQGDFARFLRAEPEHRADLLRTLFDVDRFARAEDWLAEERSAARERVAERKVRVSTLLARVAQIADVDVPEALAPELVGGGPGSHVAPWVRAVRTTAAERLTKAQEGADAAAVGSRTVDAELAAARTLEERHVRRERAVRDLAALDAREPDLVPLRAERDAGRRAEALRDVLQAAGRASLVAEQAAEAYEAAVAAWTPVSDGREGTATVARELRDEAAAATALLPDVDRAATTARSIARLRRVTDELEQTCAAAAQAAASWPSRLAEQERLVAAAQEAAVRLPALQASVAAAEIGPRRRPRRRTPGDARWAARAPRWRPVARPATTPASTGSTCGPVGSTGWRPSSPPAWSTAPTAPCAARSSTRGRPSTPTPSSRPPTSRSPGRRRTRRRPF